MFSFFPCCCYFGLDLNLSLLKTYAFYTQLHSGNRNKWDFAGVGKLKCSLLSALVQHDGFYNYWHLLQVMGLHFEAEFCPGRFFQTTEFVILTDSVNIWHVLLTLFSKAIHSLPETYRQERLLEQLEQPLLFLGHTGANTVNSSLHFLHINLILLFSCADISADSMGHSVQEEFDAMTT